MRTTRAGDFVCTFIEGNTRPMVVGLPKGNWTVDFPKPFPGAKPVKEYLGSDAPGFAVLFVIDGEGKLWSCKLPDGGWARDFLPVPSFTPAEFLGTGGQYLAVIDTTGMAWVIGGLLDGGQWVQAPTLRPPAKP